MTALRSHVPSVFDYDAELARYHTRLLEAVDIDMDARVLDIGCGTGQTTRVAARAASCGHALGIDISAAMLARARHLSNLEGIANTRFERGDAQVHPFPAERFTVGLSRFGTMFFTDPSAAFANIATALRPGAMFVQLVWQDSSRQEWHTAIREALTGDELAAPLTPAGATAFSLADPARLHTILIGAGFVDIRLAELREPVYYGADSASALAAVRSLQMTSILRDLDAASADRALGRLRTILDARDDGGGVWFDAHAWLVTARRR